MESSLGVWLCSLVKGSYYGVWSRDLGFVDTESGHGSLVTKVSSASVDMESGHRSLVIEAWSSKLDYGIQSWRSARRSQSCNPHHEITATSKFSVLQDLSEYNAISPTYTRFVVGLTIYSSDAVQGARKTRSVQHLQAAG